MKKYKYPSVLSIAGFDGSGGAGIQADIKTTSALGCYSTSVLTALPIQNTRGVRNIFPIPVKVVEEQIETVLDDIFPDAIKIGMVHTPELVESIVEILGKYPKIPIVFDPVMVATSGHKLIEDETIAAIKSLLFPISEAITPNMDEMSVLAQMEVKTPEDMKTAGLIIKQMGCKSILLKGGHQETQEITSYFLDSDNKFHAFKTQKFTTDNTHGSGCTLSSAIAAYLAQKNTLLEAVTLAQKYVYQAILNGKDVKTGAGNGPLNHFSNPQKLIKHELV